MSNLFKNNNRFALLMDDLDGDPIPNEKPINKKEDYINKNYNRTFNFDSKKNREQMQQLDILADKKDKDRKRTENENMLKHAIFPELTNKQNVVHSVSKFNKIDNSTFIEKLKFVNKIKPEDNYDKVDPGWVLIKKCSITNKIIIKYGNAIENILDEYINANVINALVAINETQTNTYINLWDEDAYEKVFLFPNYDYDYFNKLDEIYEIEMEILYQDKPEDDFLTDYDNTYD